MRTSLTAVTQSSFVASRSGMVIIGRRAARRRTSAAPRRRAACPRTAPSASRARRLEPGVPGVGRVVVRRCAACCRRARAPARARPPTRSRGCPTRSARAGRTRAGTVSSRSADDVRRVAGRHRARGRTAVSPAAIRDSCHSPHDGEAERTSPRPEIRSSSASGSPACGDQVAQHRRADGGAERRVVVPVERVVQLGQERARVRDQLGVGQRRRGRAGRGGGRAPAPGRRRSRGRGRGRAGRRSSSPILAEQSGSSSSGCGS